MAATPSEVSFPTGPLSPCEFPPLVPFLEAVPDPRSPLGRRHSLPAILALVCAAFLSGVPGYQPAAEWGRHQSGDLVRALGFLEGRTPCGSTLFEVFKPLDLEAFVTEFRKWSEAVLTAVTPENAELAARALAVDGKTLRGSRTQKADVTHILSAVSHQLGLTLAQVTQASAGAEPAGMKELLPGLLLTGRVLDCVRSRQRPNYYSRVLRFTEGKTLREWIKHQPFEQQFEFGRDILNRVSNGLPLPQ